MYVIYYFYLYIAVNLYPTLLSIPPAMDMNKKLFYIQCCVFRCLLTQEMFRFFRGYTILDPNNASGLSGGVDGVNMSGTDNFGRRKCLKLMIFGSCLNEWRWI